MIPYIGITGVMTSGEAERMLQVVPPKSTHRLMVGVLVSSTTLSGHTNRWPRRYPKIDDVPAVFPEDPRVLNLVHFHTEEEAMLLPELRAIHQRHFGRAHGFQLNMAWPSPVIIERLKSLKPGLYIALQIGKQAFELAEQHPHQVLDRALRYRGLVDTFLLDQSMGSGAPLVAEKLLPHIETLSEFIPNAGLAVAGGLGEETLHRVEPLIRRFPTLSLDAESAVRDEDDDLDFAKASAYLRRAFAMVSQTVKPA